MTTSTYSRPPGPPPTPSSPRLFLPLLPPPQALPPSLPPLPDRQPIDGWTLTRHVFSAAYPRSVVGCVNVDDKSLRGEDNPFGPVDGKTKKERKDAIWTTSEKSVARRKALKWRATVEELPTQPEPPLWMSANRFVRKGAQAHGATLVMVHANGFHKEMWEPTVRRLLELGAEIDEVWMMDLVNHGESWLLNAGRVGDVYDWNDTGRDIMSLLLHSIPEDSSPTRPLPTYLPFRPVESRKQTRRRLVGVGHSVGGNGIVQAAHARPHLFDQLLLVDPMTRMIEAYDHSFGVALSASCVGRRFEWESRESARENLLKSPYFQAWHPEVLDVMISHGLTPTATGVALTTPRWAEAAVFVDAPGALNGWNKLEYLRRDLWVKFIMAGDPATTGGEERTRQMVWRAPGSSNVIIDGSGHLLPQEHPDELAVELFRGLGGQAVKARL